LPISDEAISDCSRRYRVSSVSIGGANTGELRALDMSVGGVEEREMWEVDVLDESEMLAAGFCRVPVNMLINESLIDIRQQKRCTTRPFVAFNAKRSDG